MNAQHTPTVTLDDALKFCNSAMRNWQCVAFGKHELEDLRVELQRHREQSQAELLEALEKAVEEIEDLRKYANNHGGMIDDERCDYARAAIAKARGVQP
jgi:hypothetical protein